jgi:hypothetical protein
MRAIWRAVLTDLAGAQVAADPVPMTAAPRAGSKARKAVQRLKATSPSDPERTSRPRKAPPALPPARRQLELPLEIHEYPETVIVDPDALLAASPPAVVAVGEARRSCAPGGLSRTAPLPPHRPTTPQQLRRTLEGRSSAATSARCPRATGRGRGASRSGRWSGSPPPSRAAPVSSRRRRMTTGPRVEGHSKVRLDPERRERLAGCQSPSDARKTPPARHNRPRRRLRAILGEPHAPASPSPWTPTMTGVADARSARRLLGVDHLVVELLRPPRHRAGFGHLVPATRWVPLTVVLAHAGAFAFEPFCVPAR